MNDKDALLLEHSALTLTELQQALSTALFNAHQANLTVTAQTAIIQSQVGELGALKGENEHLAEKLAERDAKVGGSSTDWRVYHSALSQCAELLPNMKDGDPLTETPKFLSMYLAHTLHPTARLQAAAFALHDAVNKHVAADDRTSLGAAFEEMDNAMAVALDAGGPVVDRNSDTDFIADIIQYLMKQKFEIDWFHSDAEPFSSDAMERAHLCALIEGAKVYVTAAAPQPVNAAQAVPVIPHSMSGTAAARKQHDRINAMQQGVVGVLAAIKQEAEAVKRGAIIGSPSAPADAAFHDFWYSHMQNEQMQPPLNAISYSTAKFIWDSAAPSPAAQPAAQAVPELPTKLINGMEWPEGYVTDPNGVIVPPQGRVNDYNFGYNQGYGDGLLAIKDSVAAIVARTVPDGYVVVPRVPTLDMYNAACKAFCAWEVMCADEARDGHDFTQPNFTHSDAYVAMLAAAPIAQSTDTTKGA